MAVPVALIMGAAQLVMGAVKAAKESKNKAPLDNMQDPKADNTAAKYENIYKDLSNKAAIDELANSKAKIDQNRINTVNTASNVFKDPTMRFRASTLASINANRAFMDASVNSNKTRFAYLNKASEMGLAQGTVNRRIWSDIMLKKAEQQKLYEKRQAAWGSTMNAGIHNMIGGMDKDYVNDDDNKTKVFDDLDNTTVDREKTNVPSMSKKLSNFYTKNTSNDSSSDIDAAQLILDENDEIARSLKGI